MTARRLIVFSGSTFLLATALGASDARAGERSVREPPRLGSERAVEQHLADGKEFTLNTIDLIEHGRQLFEAKWTRQDGAGRPWTTGTGKALADRSSPLVFPRNFNRISGPDANSCAGCHNQPRTGGAGDQVANVFVLGQRFDFASFDPHDALPLRGSRDERGVPATLDTVANERNTVGLFGAGFIEMLARQMTARLQSLRDTLAPGDSVPLRAKGIEFGILSRHADGRWDSSKITTLAPASLASSGADDPPSLIIRPFHQAGAVVSLREFSNNAFNHHHGIQPTERFGPRDPDGDGQSAEMTRADVTAVSVYQATLAVPGRVIPRDPVIEAAVRKGEVVFEDIGCADCHVPALRLRQKGWVYSEPGPYNPPGNLRPGDAPELAVDLLDPQLARPRLRRRGKFVEVPAYTDFRLHDITSGPDDANCEPLDMHFAPGSEDFFAGNCRFLTSRLWGVASSAPYFHHGRYTTLREAIEAHRGDAAYSYRRWRALGAFERDAVIEFLKTLRVLPAGTRHRIVDEHFRPRPWPAG